MGSTDANPELWLATQAVSEVEIARTLSWKQWSANEVHYALPPLLGNILSSDGNGPINPVLLANRLPTFPRVEIRVGSGTDNVFCFRVSALKSA